MAAFELEHNVLDFLQLIVKNKENSACDWTELLCYIASITTFPVAGRAWDRLHQSCTRFLDFQGIAYRHKSEFFSSTSK